MVYCDRFLRDWGVPGSGANQKNMQNTGENAVIMEKTRELCQTIVAQPEFQNMRKRIDAFMADETAQTQYQQVVEKGEQLQQKQQRGSPLTPAEVQDFEKDRQLLVDNPVAKGFLDAQQEMHDIRHSVNKYVAKTFEVGRMPSEEDFSSCGHGCDCGS
jgi:cell fate (sporulation/competence/biofilm development) regulator YlbF (YheA/YmcA/DUF963 family)